MIDSGNILRNGSLFEARFIHIFFGYFGKYTKVYESVSNSVLIMLIYSVGLEKGNVHFIVRFNRFICSMLTQSLFKLFARSMIWRTHQLRCAKGCN